MKSILILIITTIILSASDKECTTDMNFQYITLKEYIYNMEKINTCYIQAQGSDTKMYFKIIN